ncbi:poly(A) polymerase [Candidatus Kinetoplastibacterium desouzaii TCC079E]|uniref:Poly(A) polymerase I n=1 Tax=Candidatus Kinetoplastidibacterium desouzai TCC079E TaxID=1208919 RepID=M1M4H2_9PROT|nr:polynucleotide adenylyltransferase PcnB [Candidatus Kinetoplastibacterium desouzaii]AGF47110.1 poly(A) polymerase [Candidatus Kinetoplastibacterium desouzaii TCC079E]
MFTKAVKRICSFFDKSSPRIIKKNKHNICIDTISPNAIKICRTLNKEGFSAYIVGGAIRDLMTGIKPKDFDIATNAKPEQVKALFRRAYIIGKRFKIVHVKFGQELIEISTFRSSSLEKDEHGRILKDNSFGTQEEDVARRDFTINSLYYNPINEEIIDFYNGIKDLRNRNVKIIGNPEERYREDPVRMLRAVRFASKINGTIEEQSSNGINKLKDLIKNVPQARLFDETIKILTCGNALDCLKKLNSKKLLDNLLPSLPKTLEDQSSISFLGLALSNTDSRISKDKNISPSFLLAVILWNPIKILYKKLLEEENNPFIAMMKASENILEEQDNILKIYKKITIDARDIWLMQIKFESKNIKNAYKLIEHAKFKAAYDFLQIRYLSKEFDNKPMVQWWNDFYISDETTRKTMIKEKQKRYRKKSKNSEKT